MPPSITIDHRTLEHPPGLTLFDCAERLGVRVPTSCRKNGKCRECLVEVLEGMDRLSAPSPEEAHLSGAFRLSCRARVEAAEGAVRCQTLRRGAMRIEAAGRSAAAAAADIDPAVTRRGRSVLIDGEEVASFDGPLHGLAVDLGTTTVVVRLVDLETGETRGAASFENPQRFGGSDIMARIQYDTDHPGRLLQRVLLGYLTHAIEDLGCDPSTIFEIVVAGNSTMRDILFGLDVRSIGQRPYRSITQHELEAGARDTTALVAPAKRLRLPSHPAARVASLPLIHGHVGADAAACLLAIGFLDETRTVALMDIGTNTEVIAGSRDRLFVASCPAGPAFEGGAIARGMPALEGAIESLRIDASGAASFDVIGGAPPEGICGSGLVDLLGELLRTGRMDLYGRLTDGARRFVVDAEHDIFVTEADISQLAQAKGANIAGLRIALERAGIPIDGIDVFYLAGGFAAHIDLDAARRIGLIPSVADERIARLGNAAIEGTTIALLSASRRRALEAAVRRATHVELEAEEVFFDRFVDGCLFAPARGTGGEA